MLAQYLDLTDQYNNNFDGEEHFADFEVSNYDYAVVQLLGTDGSLFFYSTIDGGAITGVTDGNIYSSDNYLKIYSTNIATGLTIDGSTGVSLGIYRLDVVGRYVRIKGANPLDPGGKLLVMLAKIS